MISHLYQIAIFFCAQFPVRLAQRVLLGIRKDAARIFDTMTVTNNSVLSAPVKYGMQKRHCLPEQGCSAFITFRLPGYIHGRE